MSAKKPIVLVGAIVLVAAAIAAAAYVLSDGSTKESPADVVGAAAVPSSEDVIALGEKVYKSQCAICHGANLEGQPNWRERKSDGRLPAPPHDETGHTWHHDDRTLFLLTKYGLARMTGQPIETDMPAYDGVLSDEEILAVLAYIKSQWPEQVRRRQAEITARAAAQR
ncbi:MAG: cytochrome c [Alphaproteobacteria bacterium]|nr:cytochrome c [Alphaproteobacteria bacterium]